MSRYFAQRLCMATNRPCRGLATTTSKAAQKRAGDISDAFKSLSGGNDALPLGGKYADLKRSLLNGHEKVLVQSWRRLLDHIDSEISYIQQLGSDVVPEIEYDEISNPSPHRNQTEFRDAYKRFGVAIIRSVIPERETLDLKQELVDYISLNKAITKGFPQDDPQVYEIYWSPTQIKSRGHPRMRTAHEFLLGFWNVKDGDAASTKHTVSYADRLRMRQPGDSAFALGPHVDGGSVERWEHQGYGKAGTYDAVFSGHWEQMDPWNLSARLDVESDLYQGIGACSAFRAAQGWLALSHIRPGEGHLLVNPLLRGGASYWLLRPFFKARRSREELSLAEYLHQDNWILEPELTSKVHGAFPGHGQEISDTLHPHLRLEKSMIHMPTVNPGDYVVWHCDTIHAVDQMHHGHHDSSVLYIPVCPLTANNAKYLRRQTRAFTQGYPSPDFGGGVGESRHIGRATDSTIADLADGYGVQSMGMAPWRVAEGRSEGETHILEEANQILGFAGTVESRI